MWPRAVVEGQVAPDRGAYLRHLGVGVQVDLLMRDPAPEALHENVVPPGSLAIHGDRALRVLWDLNEVRRRELTALVGIADFEVLEGYLQDHGRPVAFYSDKHSVFRVAKQEAKAGAGMTRVGRALGALNIETLCANSSQAKDRVERANRNLQDRLAREPRPAGIR